MEDQNMPMDGGEEKKDENMGGDMPAEGGEEKPAEGGDNAGM